MVKVCGICGDAGFADLLSICDQCKAAEHLYCMLTQPESDGEDFWYCEKCKVKQETIIQEMVVPSLHPEVKKSPGKFSKRRRAFSDSLPANKKQANEGFNGNDSSPASKKQIFEGSNGTYSSPASKKQELESSDGTKSLAASKKQSLESSNTDSLPSNKKKVHRSSNGIESLPISKMQAIENFNGIDSPPDSMKQALESSNATFSLPPSKKQALNGTNSLPGSKKQALRSSNGIESLPDSKKQAVESSNGTDSLPASKKQTFESYDRSDSLPVRKKRAHRSSNGESSLQTDRSLVELEASKVESYGGCQQKGISLQSDVLSKNLETGEFVRGNATSLPHLLKVNSVNRSCSRQSPVSMAQMIPGLVLAGSRSTMLDKSPDSSMLNASELAQSSLRCSKGINSGSGRSSLHRKSSASKITVECKKDLKELVPDGSMKGLEPTKDSPESTKVMVEKHRLSKVAEVDREDGRGLSPKRNSSSSPGEHIRMLINGTKGFDVVSAGVINNSKEIDQTLIGKSTVEDANNVIERAYQISNESIERNSITNDMGKRKLDVDAVSWNNGSLRSPNEYSKAEIGHSMINSSEINVPSSSAMENQPFNMCERGDMAGSLPSHAKNSNGTFLPHQKQLALPQSQILWKGAFKAVDIGHRPCIYDGIRAHPSTTAAPKVYEMTKKFDSQLHLEQLYRVDTWPKRFEQSPPTDDTIGLYFFPEEGKSNESYAKLVEDINKYDLSMRMSLDGAELLIYSSIHLPKNVQRCLGKFYLWGVFRRAEKSAIDHKAEGTSMPHDRVRADMANSFAPSRSDNNDSVPRMVKIPHAHKNCVKEEPNFNMEGEKDVGIAERPLRTLDCQNLGPSKVTSENGSKEMSRRSSGKHIDQSHEWYRWNGTDEEPDGRSVFNSAAPHVSHKDNSGKSPKAMHERSNVHRNHEVVRKGELNPRFGASNNSSLVEEKDELLKLGTQVENRKPGFLSSSRPIDCNPRPSSSDHLPDKLGLKFFQVEPDSKAEVKKQMDPRDQNLALSSRKNGSYRNQTDGHHNSHQSSLSSGESNGSYGNKWRSFSQPPAHRKIHRPEDVNKFNRSRSFKEDRIDFRTRREMEARDRGYGASKLGMDRHKERSHRHWRTKDGRRPVQMENHRRNPVINNRAIYSDSCSRKSYIHEKTSMQRGFSSDRQIGVKNCVNKEKVDIHNNFRSSKPEIAPIKRTEGEMFLLDFKKDCSIILSGEASTDRHRVAKDQWSFTPLHNAIDEAAENNTVSEISNAGSPPESLGQIYSGENVSPQLLEADFSILENSRTEHTSGSELDQNPLVSHGNWYAGSNPVQADLEPVEYLELFPLEEENLGMTKTVVNDWDIDLDLGLGRSGSKNVSKMADRQVCSNRSNLNSPDVSPCLGISVLPVKNEI